jgi:hypothetical protein
VKSGIFQSPTSEVREIVQGQRPADPALLVIDGDFHQSPADCLWFLLARTFPAEPWPTGDLTLNVVTHTHWITVGIAGGQKSRSAPALPNRLITIRETPPASVWPGLVTPSSTRPSGMAIDGGEMPGSAMRARRSVRITRAPLAP